MPRIYLLAGALVCAAAAPSARAEDADAIQLEEIDVARSGGALGATGLAEIRRELEKTPGAIAVIDAAGYKQTTPAVTVKDVLDYTPGVFAQPKWGEDTRLSIRGSGLSRNFYLRGVQLYADGVPISTADGYGDFQEIDPSAYRLVEVYKGANALRFGANALGGAINFVTPTGRDETASLAQGSLDAGAFGFVRGQASTSGVAGETDWFATGSAQRADGFRDDSEGRALRFSGNVGYRFSETIETRFYLSAADVDQNIPGAVTRRAAPANLALDYERDIDVVRFANRTTVRLAETTSVELGAFVVDRRLRHPIFQWLDYAYVDYGAFGRVTDEREVLGHEPARGRPQPPQWRDRRRPVRQRRRPEGRARVLGGPVFSKPVGLRREHLFCPAQPRRGDRRAVSLRATGAGRPAQRPFRGPELQSVQPQGRAALERRPEMAGLRRPLPFGRGAELRRERLWIPGARQGPEGLVGGNRRPRPQRRRLLTSRPIVRASKTSCSAPRLRPFPASAALSIWTGRSTRASSSVSGSPCCKGFLSAGPTPSSAKATATAATWTRSG